MKASNRTLYLQWFGVGVFITLVCVVASFYIVHFLSTRDENSRRELMKERQENRLFGPIRHRLEIMNSLIRSQKMTAMEAYQIVDRSMDAPFPEQSQLLNSRKEILASHQSASFKHRPNLQYQDHSLGPAHIYRVHVDPPLFPPHLGPRGPIPRRLPPGAILVLSITTVVAIAVGTALSLVLLTLYLRKRARQVEVVLAKIKAGDLHARFEIEGTDEAGLLMVRFNEMADDIEKLVTSLRMTEESRKKMLQELAHDLRTPVASVKNLQELLFTKADLLDGEKKEHLQSLAMKEVNYFERLVEDLLFLSGVNDPRYQQERRRVDLARLIHDEISYFQIGAKKVELHTDNGCFVTGDEILLRRLVRNALTNASKFSRSRVVVRVEHSGKSIVVRVIDDGPGIAESELATFGDKKFSRALDSVSGHISVGLGSVIMKKIMVLHDGTLEIKNLSPGMELKLTFSEAH